MDEKSTKQIRQSLQTYIIVLVKAVRKKKKLTTSII